MCTGNYKNYLANDIRTEVRVKAANEITLPIMHICDDFLHRSFDCHNNKSLTDTRLQSDHYCKKEPEPVHIVCSESYQSGVDVEVPCGVSNKIRGCTTINSNYSLKTSVNKEIQVSVRCSLFQKKDLRLSNKH